MGQRRNHLILAVGAAISLLVASPLVAGCASSKSSSRPPAATTTSVTSSVTSTTEGPTMVPLSTAGPTSVPTPSSTSAYPTTGVAARTTTTAARPAAPQHVEVSEADNGHTVTVARGGSVTLVLHSTYWRAAPPSNPAVLRQQGQEVITPQMQGCVAGQGCGTVTDMYTAIGFGQSRLSAHRSSCGEAMQCTGSAGDWAVTVDVT